MGKGLIDERQAYTQRPLDSTPLTKGEGPVSADYATGGAVLTSKSKFFKVPDTFRTSIQEQNYNKKTPGGELSDTEGESKASPSKAGKTPIPRK